MKKLQSTSKAFAFASLQNFSGKAKRLLPIIIIINITLRIIRRTF